MLIGVISITVIENMKCSRVLNAICDIFYADNMTNPQHSQTCIAKEINKDIPALNGKHLRILPSASVGNTFLKILFTFSIVLYLKKSLLHIRKFKCLIVFNCVIRIRRRLRLNAILMDTLQRLLVF